MDFITLSAAKKYTDQITISSLSSVETTSNGLKFITTDNQVFEINIFNWENAMLEDVQKLIDTLNVAIQAQLTAISNTVNEKAQLTHYHTTSDISNLYDILANYYTKSETLTASEIQSLISSIAKGLSWKESVDTVEDLPTENNVNGDARIVVSTNSMMIWNTDRWIDIGSSTMIDIATSDVNGLMSKEDKVKLDAIVLTNLVLKSDLVQYVKKTDLPTKTSQLINDSNFVEDLNYVHTDNNFSNRYKESMHTHTNSSTIDKLSENDDGVLLFNGSKIEGSGNIDIDAEMSDISTNPVQNKVVKKYIDDKEINVSAEVDNAIEEKDDGLYVENKTEEINSINEKLNKIKKYQKYVNTELDSCFCKVLSPYTPVEGEVVPFISVSGNMENTEGKIKLNPGKRVQVIGNINYYNQTSNSNANITYALKDITNNIEICVYQPYSSPSDTNNEFSYSFAAQYENSTNSDCEIGLVVKNVYASDTVFTTSNMTIQEINRTITINPIEYVNSTQGIEDTPIGTIIPLMSNSAPAHYLICDGTEYNIADYPYLAQHFIDEFGSVNYFGGDGTTTFAVPDLRGEFLRGPGTAIRNSGSGANVGVHQESTSMPNIGAKEAAILWTPTTDNYTAWVQNIDKGIKDDAYSGLGKYINRDGTWDAGDSSNINVAYTVRPTNTSVLYCIKYEPTYYMYNNRIYEGLDKTILWEGKAQNNGTVITLIDSIENYDLVLFEIKISPAYSHIEIMNLNTPITYGETPLINNCVWFSTYANSNINLWSTLIGTSNKTFKINDWVIGSGWKDVVYYSRVIGIKGKGE